MEFGAELAAIGAARFRLWAPAAEMVALEIEGEQNALVLPDGTRVSDPASRYQPEDVHGPSEVMDPKSYIWGDFEWRGRPWS